MDGAGQLLSAVRVMTSTGRPLATMDLDAMVNVMFRIDKEAAELGWTRSDMVRKLLGCNNLRTAEALLVRRLERMIAELEEMTAEDEREAAAREA